MPDNKRRGGRSITPEEAELWRSITRSIVPLAARSVASPPPEPERPRAQPSPPPAPLPPPGSSFHALEYGTSAGVNNSQIERMRRGKMEVEATLDLHGLTQQEAFHRLSRFIAASRAGGKRCVLIITGKGRKGGEGVLRARLPDWLNLPELRGHVLAFDTAPPDKGGSGAALLLLRKPGR